MSHRLGLQRIFTRTLIHSEKREHPFKRQARKIVTQLKDKHSGAPIVCGNGRRRRRRKSECKYCPYRVPLNATVSTGIEQFDGSDSRSDSGGHTSPETGKTRCHKASSRWIVVARTVPALLATPEQGKRRPKCALAEQELELWFLHRKNRPNSLT